MFDKELVKEILTQINAAAQRILLRFEPVKSSTRPRFLLVPVPDFLLFVYSYILSYAIG